MTLVEDRPTTAVDPFAGEHWATFVAGVIPGYFPLPFAPHHAEMWDWAWAIQPEAPPDRHLVEILARGGAKSTNAEGVTVYVGVTGRRRYALYVCDTQDRADDHVANIATMIEGAEVEEFYPDHAQRAVGKFGNSKGWRRNRLRTAGGFIVDALGLDTAARGIKVDDQRPDFMVFDDIDGLHDTPAITAKKVKTITKSILPAGSSSLAVLVAQNLIRPDGVVAQLADGRADFLRRRNVVGPVPALLDMTVTYDDEGLPVVDGTPTWVGQDVAECQRQVEDFGLAAFIEEAQHEVDDVVGALWVREQLDACRVEDYPPLERCLVIVDPSGGGGKGHDEQGIIGLGKGTDGHGYVFADESCSLSAMGWGKRAVRLAVEVGAHAIHVEDNYGGDSMTNTVKVAADALAGEGLVGAERFGSESVGTVLPLNAKGSKGERATPVAALYGAKEEPASWAAAVVHHVGVFGELEREQRTWVPDLTPKSPNRVDALVHGIKTLGILPHTRGGRRRIVRAA